MLLECLLCQQSTSTGSPRPERVQDVRKSSMKCDVLEGEESDNTCDTVEYEHGDPMRQHLVDTHSKAVARAFLYPNMSDAVHFWLMSCVEFATDFDPTLISNIEDQLDDKPFTDEHTDTEGSSPADPSVFDQKTEESEKIEEPGQIDLSAVLNAFLSQEILAEVNSNGASDTKNVRKRSAAIDIDREVKRSAIDEHASAEANNDLTLANLFEAASASGLTDSKAKNKVTCVVCKVDVCNTARQRHVFMVHVKKDDMYSCPQCDYTNSNSVWEAKKHCSVQHGAHVEPISKECNYKSLIMIWNRRCFPDWKQKRSHLWTASNSQISTGEDTDSRSAQTPALNGIEDDITAFIRDAIMKDTGAGCSDTAVVEPESSEAGGQAPEGPIDDRICHLCWEESRYPGRHIAQKHLKKHLYECSLCDLFGSYEACTVMKHIHKVHSDVDGATPISNLDRYSDEIRDLQSRCFPNRPMKLVRPKESTRPRDRHHCKICSAQVAQSDRQRHVYHKHLKATRIFECPLCNFASNYDVHRVKWHIKWMHKDDVELEPISHENEYRDEIDQLNEECFPGWLHRRKPFWWLNGEKKKDEDGLLDPNLAVDSPDSGLAVKDEAEDGDLSMDSINESSPATAPVSKKKNVGQVMKRVSEWTCRLCMKEFKPTSNFLRHVAKDHLEIPLFQCSMCDEGAVDAYDVKAHMVKVHGEADMDPISNLESNAECVEAKFHECFPNRKMKPGALDKIAESPMTTDESKVTCQECFQEMKTEDRQIHVYRHHLKEPRLYECPLCDFSHHACSSDVRAHIKFAHRENSDMLPKANLLQYSREIAEWNDKCFPGWINRKLPASVMEDFNRCRLCDEDVRQTSRHIAEAHLRIQLHVCPLCEYGAPESRLVKRHLRNAHNEEEMEPVANVVARRSDFSALHDKCFPGRPKRLANITISDEGRRTKCKCCSSTISKKKRLQHILERHMSQQAYACPICSFSHGFDETVVEHHIKNSHPGRYKTCKVVSMVSQMEDEVREMGTACFPDWTLTIQS